MEQNMNDLTLMSPFAGLPAVLAALRAALAGWGGQGMLTAALAMLVYLRIGEIGRRMERLAARFQAGRIWRREAVAGAGGVVRRAPAAPLWPRGFGWLVRACGHEAAGLGAQLLVVLARPEMVALLAQVPQARRLLRPLCRMLAVEAALLTPNGAVAASPAVKRVRRAKERIDWGRIPLPRGVLAAARRQGFAKP
jgi:hypothetical protein